MDLEHRILSAVTSASYQPVKPKALARKLNLGGDRYEDFKKALKQLIKQGRLEIGRGNNVRPVSVPHGAVTGTFRKTSGGFGFVRPHPVEGKMGQDIYIPESAVGDAATGDTVLVKIRAKSRRPDRGPSGEILQVVERVTRTFVGTYFEREGNGYVRVDGTVFAHSVYVGDPGAKGAKPDDKVVFEMLRFPNPEDRGEGVITEILGARGQPGVDTLSIIRAFGLPDEFPEDALHEARIMAADFNEQDLEGREDFTAWLTITIDPPDARDFDDAISLTHDPKSKHWQLGVHIADVGRFAPHGGALDREARRRATSVYLPQRVIPMFPEVISNGLASLQQGKVRFVKSVLIDFTPQGQVADVHFANAAIKVRKRFAYEQVSEILAHDAKSREEESESRGGDGQHQVPPIGADVFQLLRQIRDLAMVLRKRREKRGSLELVMPEAKLEYDRDGRVVGAHFRTHDISHQMIEECMLAANEAVAWRLDRKDIPFLRRIHPAPEPTKLKAFADFARSLGYKIRQEQDRYALQRVLKQSASRPEVHAVHYALLRSLKQACYSPEKDDHYALASENYCHFTSPIRRYPDLTVHRLLDQIVRRGRAGGDFDELVALGDHCSKMERRAETAERELVKYKLLVYMSERLGMEMETIITGVADYGFYSQAETLPVEGLVHVSTLRDDYYYYDDASHSLIGQRTKQRYRLGDKVQVKVVRVDLNRRQMDYRVVAKKTPAPEKRRGRQVERD
jgi:ribonuclease R